MIVGSISENKEIEKRISITPDLAKKYINLWFKVILEKNYGSHIGFNDKDYENEGTFEICKTPIEACINSDAVIVLTEWNEFKFLEWQEIYDVMQKPAWVFDARICLEKDNLKKIGFKVWSLGTSF